MDIVERLRNEIPRIGDDRALWTIISILDLAAAADEIVALRNRVEGIEMTTSREAFEKWWLDADYAESTKYAFKSTFLEAWQAGRAALLAEIKARKPYLYGDVALYRLPEGEQHE